MNKSEATTVLREMFAACPEIGRADFVSIDPDNASANHKGLFMIRLRVSLDGGSKEAIKPILDKYKLEITETKDLVAIHRVRS